MTTDRGAIVLVQLDPAVGHEQRGLRPAVIVSDSEVIREQRFPLLCVLPVTGTSLVGPLYPSLHPGRNGLTNRSWVLVDQIRSIVKARVRSVVGRVSDTELAGIDTALMLYLGLTPLFR